MAPGRPLKRRRLSPPEDQEKVVPPSKAVTDDFYSRAAKWNLEQDYEQRPRRQKKGKESTRLPIKTAEGAIEQIPEPELPDGESGSFLDSEEDDEESGTEGLEVVDDVLKVSLRRQIIAAKEELARIATLINEDPEEHAGSFKTLSQISSAASNATIKKLALATQAAVYKDVIPGYRIRPLNDEDMSSKVSKEVRQVRHFEQSLLSGYQGYVRQLALTTKLSRGEENEELAGLKSVAINCACSLLTAVPHFNLRGELLKILIDRVSSRQIDADSVKCIETLEDLFAHDEDGSPSLEAVSLLTRTMKVKDYRVSESVLNTFLHLRLLSEFSSKASQTTIDKPSQPTFRGKKLKEKREFRTKKQRKLEKERKAVEKNMKEADATVSHEERDRMQAETLKLVFSIYFRILKLRVPALMGAVLEGLAEYAHLINQDFFGDLLEALKDLISQNAESTENAPDLETATTDTGSTTPTRNTIREVLLCTTTAFALLEGQDASKAAPSLNLDLSFFITHLYRQLYPLCLNPDVEFSSKSLRLPDPHSSHSAPTPANKKKINIATPTLLLLNSLSSILLPPTTPPFRNAAFTKRLLTSSLHTPEKSTLATLSLLNKVAKQHGRRIAPLWHTEERRGDGVFDGMSEGVEGSNVFASTVWEGEVLRLHFAPGVREGVRALEGVIADVV